MPTRRRRYHKVDLERTLLDTAATLLARGGPEAVSLRELGRLAGVSRSAAYHYFPDKAALLARVGEQGFTVLRARVQRAVDPAAPLEEQLVAGLSAYVAFALDDAPRFRLMFGNVLARPLERAASAHAPPLAFSSAAARDAFGELLLPLEAAHARGALGRAEPLIVLNACWAFAHGVAELALGDNLKPAAVRETVLRDGLTALLAGFQRAR